MLTLKPGTSLPPVGQSSPKIGGLVLAADAPVEAAPNGSATQMLQGYSAMLTQQAAEVEIWGLPVTLFLPRQRNMEGYEDELNKSPGGNYDTALSKAFIDLQPKRGVFYKYNWFPENQDELTAITFHPSVSVFADCYVRSLIDPSNPSPFGDLMFKIVRVFDTGKYQVLQRVAFAVPVTDQQTWAMLLPNEQNR